LELDELLDELPPALARKVAAALAPDADDDEEEFTIEPYLRSPGPCPVSYETDVD
jgi:hypothetical protein